MITKYKTSYSNDSIEKVEVVRETEKCVFFSPNKNWGGAKEQRESKQSDWNNYHDTWKEAHDYLLAKAHSSVSNAESRFMDACSKRTKVEALKEHP